MKLASLILTSCLFFISWAYTHAAEVDEVKVPLQHYLRAHETGNAEFVRLAFASDARIIGYLRDNYLSLSVDQYAARFSGQPEADEVQRRRSVEVLEVSGNAALAKVVLDYPKVKFVDYMALLKIKGEWKIVSKTFHAQFK